MDANVNQDASVPYKILFVDDEPKSRKYFKQIFSPRFSIETSGSVDDAIKVLETDADNIGVLVTDYRMPHKVGTDLLRYTRRQFPNIVRIMTTAYCDSQGTVDAINNGEIFRYIVKPWDASVTEEILETSLQRYLHNNITDALQDGNPYLLDQFKDACQKWLLHAYHTCNTVGAYQNGLEAIEFLYQHHIQSTFQHDRASQLRAEMEDFLENLTINSHVESGSQDTCITDQLTRGRHENQ